MRTVQTKTILLVALVAAGAAVGCYPKAGPAPGAISPAAVEYASTKWPGTTEAQLAEGKDLYQAKCNGCHAYPDLVAIDEDDWKSIVERMTGKADLPPEKSEVILHYVLATRSELASAKPAK
jgi:cytochrome c5